MRPQSSIRLLTAAALCAALAAPSLAQGRSARSRGKSRVVGKVNLNTASAKQLMLLPRVGKRSAQAILAYRAQHRFQTIREIIRVKGIGKRSFLRLRQHLTVRGPNTIRKIRPKRAPTVRRRKASRRKASRRATGARAHRAGRARNRRTARRRSHRRASRALPVAPRTARSERGKARLTRARAARR